DALPEVRAALKDEFGPVRCAAAEAAWKIEGRPQDALPVLRAALKDPDDYTRCEAALCLAQMGREAREAAGDLRTALKDAGPRVRFNAAAARLGKNRQDRQALPVFLATVRWCGLPSDDARARVESLRLLAELARDDRAALPILRDALRAEPHRVHAALAD